MEEFGRLRRAAEKSERERLRAQRWARLLSSAFLGLTSLVFVTGLTLVAAAFGPQVGIDLPLHRMGLLGEVAASIAPSPVTRSRSTSSTGSGSDPRAAPILPSPIPTETPTLTVTASRTSTSTPTPRPSDTPTPSSTPTASLTPSPTPIPSLTPTPSETPFGTPPASSTFTPSPSPTEGGFPDCSPGEDPAFESAVLDLINDERKAAGLPAYIQDGQLQAAARIHSTDMACNGFFSHTGSDGSSVGERVTEQGYSWSQVGENIFATSDISADAPQLAFDWWMASRPSRANILHKDYTEIGIGYIHEPTSPFGGYFTVVFARP